MTELFRSASPREEGELEDGEISDDSVRPDSPKPFRHRSRGHPHQYHARPSRPNPHNYRPKEQYRLPSRIPPPAPLGDMGSRPSFWERSHDTLGRFRSRGRGGRFWDREWLDRGVKPGGPRQMNCGWRDPSPRKLKGRSPPRKPGHCVEESFEELLLKYKQIKLELESINKDEKLALKEGPVKEEVIVVEKTTEPPALEEKSPVEEALPVVVVEEKPPVKIFQAFELKPLRQRLKPIAEQKQNPLEETKSPVNEEERPVESAVCPKGMSNFTIDPMHQK